MNANPNPISSDSQAGQILAALMAGEHLTPMDALNRFGCFRLGARIYDLKKQGYEIETELIEVSDGKRVAEYWMHRGAEQLDLIDSA